VPAALKGYSQDDNLPLTISQVFTEFFLQVLNTEYVIFNPVSLIDFFSLHEIPLELQIQSFLVIF
jgi:hypothetical protein